MTEGLYDRAMLLVRDALRAQEIWQSAATLASDLRMALNLLDSLNPPDCPRCGLPMTFTATAPTLGAPMEWRCFGHTDAGTTEGQQIIEIDEDCRVSGDVRGPIREA